jgi:hypothetical protein
MHILQPSDLVMMQEYITQLQMVTIKNLQTQ